MSTREVVPAPAWFLRLVAKPKPVPRPVLASTSAGSFRYGDTAIEAAIREVESAPPGQGNGVLNGTAYHLGQLVGAGLADHSAVVEALVHAAVRRGGESEARARAIVESGLGAGKANPRTVARFEAVRT